MSINLSDIPKRISKDEAIQRIMTGLGVSEAEAEEVYEYDQLAEHDSSIGQLPPEKEAVARKMCHTGTREHKSQGGGKKGPTVYKLDSRKRKPNATKGGLVTELAEFIKASEFEVQNLQVPNPEQKISFQIGDKWYSWALTEHRTKPKWCE